MANNTLFETTRGNLAPAADAVNNAGGMAYDLPQKQKLAQYAITGCLTATYYVAAKTQLDTVVRLASQVDDPFVARTAIYCRTQAFMKDTPALLVALLMARGSKWAAPAFEAVVDNGRMLRNVVQMLRSGALGRKSLGTAPKRLIKDWLEKRSDKGLFFDAVGTQPSMADIVKMVHPRTGDVRRNALYAWLLGRPADAALLPDCVRDTHAFLAGDNDIVPAAPFQMLTSADLTQRQWTDIALHASWQTLRQNLNTFARHGVFQDPRIVDRICWRLADARAIREAKVFPYQLLMAHAAAAGNLPEQIVQALEAAMEIALENVPALEGRVVLCPDVSGSMSSPVTGYRKGATSRVRCIDVAALMAAALMRTNANALVLPFENDVVEIELDPRAGVLANAMELAAIGGGGTDCAAPLRHLNREKIDAATVIFISDNESWIDSVDRPWRNGTATMKHWNAFHSRHPGARLACIDIQPYGTCQARERHDILNVGGFSDDVFRIVGAFARGELEPGHWVAEIEKTPVREPGQATVQLAAGA